MANEIQKNIYQKVVNPYTNMDSKNTLSPFQLWLDKIGLTNFQGKAAYQQQLNSNMWASEQASRMADIEYNNPENQSDLMRQAGINPDLNGLQNFEASSFGNPMNVPSAMPTEIEEPLGKIARGIFDGIQFAVGLGEGITKLSRQILDNKKERDKITEDETKNALDYLVNFLNYKGDYNSKDNAESRASFLLQYTNSLSNKRIARKVYRRAMDLSNTAAERTRYYESKGKEAAAKTDFAETLANPLYNVNDEDMISTIRDYNEMFLDVERLNVQFQKESLKLGKASAQYQYVQGSYKVPYDMQKKQAEFQNLVNEKMTEFFQKQLDKDNLWTQILLMSMFSSQTGAFNPLQVAPSAIEGLMRAIPVTRFFHHLR